MSATVDAQVAKARVSGLIGPRRWLLAPEPWKALAFMLTSFLLGTAWLVLLTALIAIGGMLWIHEARLERWRFQAMLGVHIHDPHRPLPQGSDWRRLKARVCDRQTWLDLVYTALLFPIGVAELVIAAAFVFLPIELLISPLLYTLGSPIEAPFQFGSGITIAGQAGNHLDTSAELVPAAVAGLVLLVALPYVLIGVVRVHAWVARPLLGGQRATASTDQPRPA